MKNIIRYAETEQGEEKITRRLNTDEGTLPVASENSETHLSEEKIIEIFGQTPEKPFGNICQGIFPMNSEQIQDAREMMDIFKQNNFKNLNDESVHQIVAIRKVRELPYFYEISMAYLNGIKEAVRALAEKEEISGNWRDENNISGGLKFYFQRWVSKNYLEQLILTRNGSDLDEEAFNKLFIDPYWEELDDKINPLRAVHLLSEIVRMNSHRKDDGSLDSKDETEAIVILRDFMDIHKHIKEPTTETYYCDALKRIPASPESDTLDADITVTQAQNQAREFAKAIVYSCFKHFDTSRPAEEFVQGINRLLRRTNFDTGFSFENLGFKIGEVRRNIFKRKAYRYGLKGENNEQLILSSGTSNLMIEG